MDKQIIIRTVLGAASPLEGQHRLFEQSLSGKINIRGNEEDPQFSTATEKILGISLPTKANTVSSSAKKSIFWLGPDEWLVHLPLEETHATLQDMREAMADQRHALTDVSDYYTVIELAGPQARSVLASASPFDTREDRFKPGDCAQTRFGHASILLWVLNEKPAYALQVRWSYAQYVYDYLAQSIHNAEAIQALS